MGAPSSSLNSWRLLSPELYARQTVLSTYVVYVAFNPANSPGSHRCVIPVFEMRNRGL